jgi:hypothetical protein
MAMHPDDPPRPIFGLPRIVKNRDDLMRLVSIVDSPANGLTLCSGSLGADLCNNIEALVREFGGMGRIHFGHLRNVKVEQDGTFYESTHNSCDGSLDMAAIVKAYHDVGFEGYCAPGPRPHDLGRNRQARLWPVRPRARGGVPERLVGGRQQIGVSLAVMLQHRLREAAVGLRGILAAGELGELVSANASVRWWRPQSYYDEPGRGTLARDGGGVLITQAIHMLDLLLSLIGLPDRVTGVASTSPMHSMEGEDCAAALLHYARGAVAVVQATTAAYPGFAERIELNCTAGSATLESGRLQVNFLSGKTMTIGAAQGSGGGWQRAVFCEAAPYFKSFRLVALVL